MISWISLFYCKCFSCVVFFHLLFFTFFPIDIFKSMSIKLESISRPCYKYCYNPTLGLDFLFTYYIKVLIGEVWQFAKLSLNSFSKKCFIHKITYSEQYFTIHFFQIFPIKNFLFVNHNLLLQYFSLNWITYSLTTFLKPLKFVEVPNIVGHQFKELPDGNLYHFFN